ncbi:NUDIX hydrolase [Streptococcus saliviloxodontae]|uniref:8-oxo-dGTP pyrophosphatase MutT (NUDIX family) n=1 Tax=Streptococcus saliviloxodontae TaxID=1349416 RepID=A0ABS2PK53_9STRE|nr:NUDIX domain-containing protein [Streptococcus saliviloxodontae]MBM7635810.1 8-oxo-dGTP pyrophosphatase MutT (NUDIX family) [Streptococcus saliviloxodontae]
MTQDYISYIRSKVGHDKVLLAFAGGILADQEGCVLLQLRGDKKTWAVPGGAMELGESSKETAEREFFEETGIKVEAIRLLNIYSHFDEVYPNGDQVQTLVVIYEMRALEEVDIIGFQNEETLKLSFFSEEAIAKEVTISDKHRLMLTEYFADSFALGH